MPFAAKWRDIQIVTLNEVSKKEKVWYHLYAEYKKKDGRGDWDGEHM